jgi:hypothetical protein
LGSADDAPGKSAAGHHGVRWGICSSLHLQARVQEGWKRVRQENHGVPERIKHGNGWFNLGYPSFRKELAIENWPLNKY